jgi:hypothetical protein
VQDEQGVVDAHRQPDHRGEDRGRRREVDHGTERVDRQDADPNADQRGDQRKSRGKERPEGHQEHDVRDDDADAFGALGTRRRDHASGIGNGDAGAVCRCGTRFEGRLGPVADPGDGYLIDGLCESDVPVLRDRPGDVRIRHRNHLAGSLHPLQRRFDRGLHRRLRQRVTLGSSEHHLCRSAGCLRELLVQQVDGLL